MLKTRRTSVVVLITLAELAWLASFGLLFAYKGKVSEAKHLLKSYAEATNTVAQLKAASPDLAKLVEERNKANEKGTMLQARLEVFNKLLQGRSPREVETLLAAGERAADELKASGERRAKMTEELAEKQKALDAMLSQLNAATNTVAELTRKWAALPPNLEQLYRDATNRVAELETEVGKAHTEIGGLNRQIGVLQEGEIGIRRELTGLPTNELRSVVFIVDTSSSMRSSPAWGEARKLMRTWVEHLSVRECRLVNFNDRAVAYPTNSYLRVRDTNGVSLTNEMKQLLTKFDDAEAGVYSDLLKGLRLAYSGELPDLIVMLTDGHPHVATKMDGSYAAEILKEVAKHPKVPILSVAVGSYEVEGAGGPRERRNAAISFMKELARATGGNFLGR